MELFQAHHQWSTRPADQNFSSLEAMYFATRAYAARAGEKTVKWGDLRVEAGNGSNLTLVGKAGIPARLTNYAFGQLSSRVSAPASYLRALPATLAAQNLNHGLANQNGSEAALLFHRLDDGLLLRAATSDRYTRIWNWEVLERLIVFANVQRLTPAHQTFSWSGGAVPTDAQRALYASDHDMFAFLMSDAEITDPVGKSMRRGVIVANSEVGAAALSFMGFWFRDVCANHIIWGAEQVAEVRIRHVGEVHDKMLDAQVEVRRYLNSSVAADQERILKATVRIADTKEAVLDRLFGIRSLGLTRKALTAGIEAVVEDEDGDARSVWGVVQGLTRASQQTQYQDERVAMDRAAGRLLEISF